MTKTQDTKTTTQWLEQIEMWVQSMFYVMSIGVALLAVLTAIAAYVAVDYYRVKMATLDVVHDLVASGEARRAADDIRETFGPNSPLWGTPPATARHPH